MPPTAPAASLTAHMQAMLTRMGFHDGMGSRRRSVRFAAAAPPRQFGRSARAHTSSLPAVSSRRTAVLPICLPRCNFRKAATPEQAEKMARTYLQTGLDGIKLFTGVYKGEDKPVVNMDVAIAKAAVDVAHAQGKPVFAHPQNTAGIEAVITAGRRRDGAYRRPAAGLHGRTACAIQAAEHRADADIVAVRKIAGSGRDRRARSWTTSSVSSKAFRTMAGCPVRHRRRLHPLYDTTLEYELMRRALSERQVLASLTTNPAEYFKAAKKGRAWKQDLMPTS